MVVTRFYDAADRMIEERDVHDKSTIYRYDAAGNAVAVTDSEQSRHPLVRRDEPAHRRDRRERESNGDHVIRRRRSTLSDPKRRSANLKPKGKTEARLVALTSFLACAQFVLGGALLSACVLVVSFFQSGKRAEYTRLLSLAPLLVSIAMGILRAIWVIVAWLIVRRKYMKNV
jgi:YD repeat-containing protein